MGAIKSRPSSSESSSSDEDPTQTGRPTYEELCLIVREAMQRTQREIEQKKLAEKNTERKKTDEASVDGKNTKNTRRKLIKRRSNKIQPVECSQVPQEHSEPEKNFPEVEQTSYGSIWHRKFRPSLTPIIEEYPAEPSACDQEEKPNEDDGQVKEVKEVKLPKLPVCKREKTRRRKEGQRECNDNKLPTIPVVRPKTSKMQRRPLAHEKWQAENSKVEVKLPALKDVKPGNETQPMTSKVKRLPLKIQHDESNEKLPPITTVTDTKKPGKETLSMQKFPPKEQLDKCDVKLPPLSIISKPVKQTQLAKTSKSQKLLAKEQKEKSNVKLPLLSMNAKPSEEVQIKMSAKSQNLPFSKEHKQWNKPSKKSPPVPSAKTAKQNQLQTIEMQKFPLKEPSSKSDEKLPLLTIEERPAKEAKLEIQDYRMKLSSKNHWNKSNENPLLSLTAENMKESQPKLQELNANEVLNKYRSNEKLPQLTVKGRPNMVSRPKTGNLQKFSSKNILDKNDEKFKMLSPKAERIEEIQSMRSKFSKIPVKEAWNKPDKKLPLLQTVKGRPKTSRLQKLPVKEQWCKPSVDEKFPPLCMKAKHIELLQARPRTSKSQNLPIIYDMSHFYG